MFFPVKIYGFELWHFRVQDQIHLQRAKGGLSPLQSEFHVQKLTYRRLSRYQFCPDQLSSPYKNVWFTEHTKMCGSLRCRTSTMRRAAHSFWMCKVRCWRWLFGNQVPISLMGLSPCRCSCGVAVAPHTLHPTTPTPYSEPRPPKEKWTPRHESNLVVPLSWSLCAKCV